MNYCFNLEKTENYFLKAEKFLLSELKHAHVNRLITHKITVFSYIIYILNSDFK